MMGPYWISANYKIWFQNKRQSTRRIPKPAISNTENIEPPIQPRVLSSISSASFNPNLPSAINSGARIPFSLKTNHAPLSPKSKNIVKPSLETTCLSSCAPKRPPLRRTPSLKLGEGIGGKATVVFEETEIPVRSSKAVKGTKRRVPSEKPSRTKKVRRDDPGKENIPPAELLGVRNPKGEPGSADLEEIALGLVALRDGR
jgi:hypothetical protein